MGSAGDGAVRRKHDSAGDAQQVAQYDEHMTARETRLTALDDALTALDGAGDAHMVRRETRGTARWTSRGTAGD